MSKTTVQDGELGDPLEAPDPDAILGNVDLQIEPLDERVPLEKIAHAYQVTLDSQGAPSKVDELVDFNFEEVQAASRIPAENVQVLPNAKEIISARSLEKALRRCAILRGVGEQTMKKLYEDAGLAVVPKDAEIIAPKGIIKGLLIPLTATKVAINSSIGGMSTSVKERELKPDDYLGEYMMAGAARPTASVVNLSDERDFVYISRELFASLHPRAQEQIKLSILRRSPLVRYEDVEPLNPENDQVAGPAVCMERETVPQVLANLELTMSENDIFKPHMVKKYEKDELVTPSSQGYLGLIVNGGLRVNISSPTSGKISRAIVKKGNTIFEANAAGVEPPAEVEVLSDDSNTQVVWIYLAPDDPNYRKLIDAALEGQAYKLDKSNVREAVIRTY